MMGYLNSGEIQFFIVVKMNVQIEANLLITEFEPIFQSEVVQTSFIFQVSDTESVTLDPFFILNSLKNVERITYEYSTSVIKPRNPIFIYSLTETRNFTQSCDKIFYLNTLLLCKYIRLDKSVYQVFIDDVLVPPFVTITIDFKITKINITDNEDLIMVNVDEDGYLDVCIALLDRKWKQLKENDIDIERPEADHCEETLCLIENILTFVCLIVSMVCLLLTFLTYCMFPVLRTKAGVNNMFLSLSLLLAQVSLMFSTFTSVDSFRCLILGVLTHFLWLWNFSWNFICSFCMFRVFTAGLTTHNQPNRTSDILKWISGSFVLPVSVVSAVLIYSYFTSQGREFGYGNVQCYLDLPFFIGIAVAAPLFIITLTNISLFLVVVYKIYSVRRLQSISFMSSAPDFDMTIYMKLSTVTGMFWIVAVLAEFSENEIFGLVALVLNGLQGVSIFFSFVCNKRVVALCSALLRQHQS
ncbi:adhesion G protein-coupled receptor L3-like isoform X1 [Biomphalaria glabrata]|uniref:Adhesion G protein-coupled receptor L3-like isoform X1 n=1 Tax=Biomphalaria glabrata TaxID=6526 RepID=A0A9W2ZIX5_BIOGL|nr:adhesion G protein-coupled receptor L3-like isoform X1 [Biomphalaria glabrata]